MAELILPDNRFEAPELLYPNRKPVGNVRVDTRHLMSRGLVSKILCRKGFAEDVITGALYSDPNGNIYGDVAKHGENLRSTTQHNSYLRLTESNPTSGVFCAPVKGVSVGAVIRRTGAQVTNAPIFANLSPNASPYTVWGLDNQGTGTTLRFSLDGGGSYSEITSNELDIGRYVKCVGTYNGSVMKLFVNGKQVASSSKTGDLVYFNTVTRGAAIGNFFNFTGNRSFVGEIYTTDLWKRGLTDAEAESYTRDPYQMLIPA